MGAASPKHVEFTGVVMRLLGRSAYSLSKGQKLHKKEAPCMMKVQQFFNRVLKLNAFFAMPGGERQRSKARNKLFSGSGFVEA